ncbi:MAG TPA: hypothetical protein VK088_09215 [Acidimicrobiia bacterium]|nr:hypothetical protein [Acidimicrobiia bacterium]
MNTEERVRLHLQAKAGRLDAPDRLEEVMREGRLRRIRRQTATVLGAAALVAAVVGLAANLIPDTQGTVAVSPDTSTADPAPTTSTSIPGAAPTGVLVADAGGITSLARDGSPGIAIAGDPTYPIATVYPDQMGGIIYQHVTTPLPWEQGTLLWLQAGADSPEPLAVPEPGGRLTPVGPALSTGFVYLLDEPTETAPATVIMIVDLADGVHEEIAPLAPTEEVSAGGDLLAIVDRTDVMCPQLRLIDVHGAPRQSPLPDCLPVGAGISVSPDGSRLALLAEGTLTEYHLVTGETGRQIGVPDAYMVTSGAGGWAVRSPEEVRLIGPDWEESLPAVESGWVVPFARLELGADPALESGSDQLPCVPTELDLPDQDLPAPVAETRRALFDLASACDYEGLAELVAVDGTTISYGAPDDPFAFWVGEARRGTEPLSVLTRLLAMSPGLHADGWYGWPAVHVDPGSEANWEELDEAGIDDGVVESPEGRAYYGYRVGIAADGTWMFFVAGD